jgi:hypothetical protein
VKEQRLREALLDARVPDAAGAEERAWRLIRAAYVSSPPPLRRAGRAPGRRSLRIAVALVLLAALVISPAGATVRHWVGDTVGSSGHRPSQPALTGLPAPGSLLVDSARGPWVVHEDGSRRLLGSYAESAWSPHGLYVAVAGAHQLAAVDPVGAVRWSLSRQGPVRDPSWSPDGERIAYLSGGELRMVAGDGTGDRLLAPGAAAVGPSWRPGGPRVVAYVGADGVIRALDVGSGRVELLGPAPDGTGGISWSADGSRLLVAGRSRLLLLDPGGGVTERIPPPAGESFRAAAIAPDGQALAAVLSSHSGSNSELLLYGKGGGSHRLFAGLGRFDDVVYSPGGRWLLLTWRSADQWLFLNPAHPRRVVAISDIAAQFDPGTTAPPSFPSVAGWCCPPAG